MSIKKIITGLTLSMLLGSGLVVAADFNKGLKAAQSGDFKTALAEWTPLAEQGNSGAQYNLGLMYDNGRGVPENDKTAVKWFTKAAEQGHAKAQGSLGVMYTLGQGVPLNYNQAFKWLIKAAEQGDARAQYNVGLGYEFGKGPLTNYVRAYMWYNLGDYNGEHKGAEGKARIVKVMTKDDISKAQDMSSRCLESNYTDC